MRTPSMSPAFNHSRRSPCVASKVSLRSALQANEPVDREEATVIDALVGLLPVREGVVLRGEHVGQRGLRQICKASATARTQGKGLIVDEYLVLARALSRTSPFSIQAARVSPRIGSMMRPL